MAGIADSLNAPQRAAVEYCSGPELVIAGAGSGKTRVITYKIAHLLAQGMKPYNILALTFTNKAAREMQERISLLAGPDVATQLWMGTFHSIFGRILRRHADRIGYKSNFTIYDASDSKSLIKNILRQMQLDDKTYRPGAVQSEISNAKNALLTPEEYASDPEITRGNQYTHTPEMPRIYAAYCERCRVAGAMDFDDLLMNTYILFRDNPDVLEHYRSFFAYVLVDEYQDTNRAQHLILRQLCAPDRCLCVVGDDSQSIYSFRGANIRNILDMKQTYPALQIFKLEENYRSTRTILNAANSLIEVNKDRIPKEVFSNGEQGEPIEITSYSDAKAEAGGVASRLVQVRRRLGIHYSDIAVLYRTNAQSRELEEAFRSRNIPYRVYGGLSFYQRKEVKDAICYLRLCVNPDDDSALERVVNTPKRGIGDTTVNKIRDAAMEHKTGMFDVMQCPDHYGLALSKGTLAKTNAFVALILSLAGQAADGAPAIAVAKELFDRTGLVSQYESDNTPEYISKKENLEELLAGIGAFCERAALPEDATVAAYLSEISLLTDAEVTDDGNPDDCVTLMTIHAAKGLEFDAVFIVGVEDQLLPSERSRRNPAEIEEERRLLYVAITRAKQYCKLSYADFRMINGMRTNTLPSRFISEIDMRYLSATGGTRLRRPAVAVPRGTGFAPAAAPPPRPAYKAPAPAPVQRIGHTAAPAAHAAGAATHKASELNPGQTIEHLMYGRGTVLSIDTTTPDHRAIIRFADGTDRTMLLKFARFKIIE